MMYIFENFPKYANSLATSGGKVLYADEAARASISGYYTGVDLMQRFEHDICSHYKDDPWAWINDRVQEQNYEGLFVSDWITVTMEETVRGCGINDHHMRIMGINTHTDSNTHQSGSGALKGHIDFCSLESFGDDSYIWNEENMNNGTQQEPCPYMLSDFRTYLTGTVYNALPEELKAVIVDKYNYIESRYSASSVLTDSTSCDNKKNMGKVWAPTEYEVFGSAIWGTKSMSEGCGIQYPLFKNNTGRIMYRYNDNGDHSLYSAYWWTASACGGSSDHCVSVDGYGRARNDWTECQNCAPLCFRIAQN